MSRLVVWYCSNCQYGPLSTTLDTHCVICQRRQDNYAIHAEGSSLRSPSIIVTQRVESASESPSLKKTDVKKSASALYDHDAHDTSHAKSVRKTIAANRGTPTKRLDRRLLSRINSSGKDAQLNTFLSNEVDPWHPQQLIVQTAQIPLPGVGVPFFVRTGEHMTSPPRRQTSPTRRAEIAITRSRGACKRCRKNKSLCRHKLHDNDALPTSSTPISGEGSVELVPQDARARGHFEYSTRRLTPSHSILTTVNTDSVQQVAPLITLQRPRRNNGRSSRIRVADGHNTISGTANRRGPSSSSAPSIDRTSMLEDEASHLSYASASITGSPAANTRNQQYSGESSTYDEGQFIASAYQNASNPMMPNQIEIPHHENLDRFDKDSNVGVPRSRRLRRNMQLVEGMPLDYTGPIEATLDFENNTTCWYPSSMELTESSVEGNHLTPTRIVNPQTPNDIGATSNDLRWSPTLHHRGSNPPDIWQNIQVLPGPGIGLTTTHNGMYTTSAGDRSALCETIEQSISSRSGNDPLRPVYTSIRGGFSSQNVDRASWNDRSSMWYTDTGLTNHDPAILSDRNTDTHPRAAIDDANSNLDFSSQDEQYDYLQDNEFITDEDLKLLNDSNFTSLGSTDSTNRSGITPPSEKDGLGS